MGQEMIIRPGEERDAETLIDFIIAMARETEHKELQLDVVSSGVRKLLRHAEHGFYVVAENDGEVVGTLMITKEWSDWRNGFFWWIQSVYVRPEFRRQGVYKQLYEHIKARSVEQGNVCGLRLYVVRENTTARRTYEALGMRETFYKVYEESLL